MPSFKCNFLQQAKVFDHFWEHTVGSGNATLALRADWQKQLLRCHRELGFRHVRFHALLSDSMGTLVSEENKLIYSFFNADRIMDFLLSIGMRPFVELSFMPEALASGTQTVFRYRANVTQPADYRRWGTLIRKLAGHWIERYGAAEVRQWFFEVWNEPNLSSFWKGSQQDYFRLYRETALALKRVDAALPVGGPATADNKWITPFLDYCHRHHVPVDFVTTHHYPTDAFGKTSTDTVTQLQHFQREAMNKKTAGVRREARDLPLYYTEWNCSSNPRDPLHDEPFAAALATRIIMDAQSLAQGYSFWTFSDIFEENYFPSVPFHGGFGLLNLYGVPKPVYRAFQLLHHLGENRLDVEGRHSTVDVWVVKKDHAATILMTNLAMPRHAIQTEMVEVSLNAAPLPRRSWIERIEEDHANPRREWEEMGKPEYLSPLQVRRLEIASRVGKEDIPWKREAGAVHFSASLPPQSLAAITFEFA
ncbi:MAG TPA: glycosyl hydrolase [Bryobacteraceae bacterium]|nr:glycosyl hydrolase [Bryobacteraceae bacterium]